MPDTAVTPAPRVPLMMPIEFRKTYSRQVSRGGLLNLSLTGAFLELSPENIDINDQIHLHVKVSGRERVLHANIIWKNTRGAGIHFNPENNQDVQIIDDLIYFVKTRRESKRDVLNSIFVKIID